MACHGGFKLDEATRRSWYNPEAILGDLQLGMTFVDVGCGDGFFTLLASQKVGASGKVYAVDADSSAIEKLQGKIKTQNLKNITVRVGKAEDTLFCQGCADIVFYSMDLHDFTDPAKVLANAKEMIKPSGRLVDLDWKKMDMPFGPPTRIRFSQEFALELLAQAGFRVEKVVDVGPYHYLIVAKPT